MLGHSALTSTRQTLRSESENISTHQTTAATQKCFSCTLPARQTAPVWHQEGSSNALLLFGCWPHRAIANGQRVAAPALSPSSQKLIPLAGTSHEPHEPPRLSVIVPLVPPVPSFPVPPRWPSPFLLSCLSPPENSRKQRTETTGALGKITIAFLPPLPSPSSLATLQGRRGLSTCCCFFRFWMLRCRRTIWTACSGYCPSMQVRRTPSSSWRTRTFDVTSSSCCCSSD